MDDSKDQAKENKGCATLLLAVIGTLLICVGGVFRDWIGERTLDKAWAFSGGHWLTIVFVLSLIANAGLFLGLGRLTNQVQNAEAREKAAKRETERQRVEILRHQNLSNLLMSWLLLFTAKTANGGFTSHREKVAKAFLRDVMGVIDPVSKHPYRGSIWHRPTGADFLHPLEHVGMPDDSLLSDRFYVGEGNAHRSGVAGDVFRRGTLRVVHLRQDASGAWVSDAPDFIPSRNPMESPQFRSFVVVPIKNQPDLPPIGVLCLDSPNEDTFDNDELKKMLLDSAEKLAIVFGLLADHYNEGEYMADDEPEPLP